MLPLLNKKSTSSSTSSLSLSNYQNLFNNTQLTSNSLQALWSSFFSNQFVFAEQNLQLIANNYIQQQYLQQHQKIDYLKNTIDSNTKNDTNNLKFLDSNLIQPQIEKQKKQQNDYIQQSIIQNALALFMNSSMLNCFENKAEKKTENNLSMFFQTQLKHVAAAQQNLSAVNLAAVTATAAVTQTGSIEKYFQSDENKLIDSFLQSSATSESASLLLNQKANLIQKNFKKKYNVS